MSVSITKGRLATPRILMVRSRRGTRSPTGTRRSTPPNTRADSPTRSSESAINTASRADKPPTRYLASTPPQGDSSPPACSKQSLSRPVSRHPRRPPNRCLTPIVYPGQVARLAVGCCPGIGRSSRFQAVRVCSRRRCSRGCRRGCRRSRSFCWCAARPTPTRLPGSRLAATRWRALPRFRFRAGWSTDLGASRCSCRSRSVRRSSCWGW